MSDPDVRQDDDSSPDPDAIIDDSLEDKELEDEECRDEAMQDDPSDDGEWEEEASDEEEWEEEQVEAEASDEEEWEEEQVEAEASDKEEWEEEEVEAEASDEQPLAGHVEDGPSQDADTEEPVGQDADEEPAEEIDETALPAEPAMWSQDVTSHSPDDSEPELGAALVIQSIPIERTPMTGPPVGIRRADRSGMECIDALAGRSSVLGFGFDPITEAIQNAAEGYLGDAAALSDVAEDDDDLLLRQFQELLGDHGGVDAESIILCSSADMAVESAITFSRCRTGDSAYRTIAMVGSDHGRSGVCRTASGRPELHQGYGPMMAGFAHVPAGDLEMLSQALDEQTAAVLLSPIDFNDACRTLDADYLAGVRELCDQRGILLLMDESRLCFAASGRPLTFSSASQVTADAVILGGGLFAGLAGGIVLASRKLTGQTCHDTGRHPMLAAIASTTLEQMKEHRLPESAAESSHGFALALAELVGGFEFVRDLHVSGMTIGMETDIVSAEIVHAAWRRGLRLESAGETGIRIQPPLVMSDEDRDLLLQRLSESMEQIERSVADVTA